jgi:hypothetical protein
MPQPIKAALEIKTSFEWISFDIVPIEVHYLVIACTRLIKE